MDNRNHIDLTMPIENHFRWKVDRRLTSSFENGDPFQVTKMGWAVHGFTHIDAPRHIDSRGLTTSSFTFEELIGAASVIDLSDIQDEQEISGDMLEAAGHHVRPEERILIKTAWDERYSPKTPDFWKRSPYLSRNAVDWLYAFKPKAVGFDFPQDYPIRGLLNGEEPQMSQMVSHDRLLRNGILLIEYLCNLAKVNTKRVELIALPLKILEADGAPLRVVVREIFD